jgi:copper chaperone CopZ
VKIASLFAAALAAAILSSASAPAADPPPTKATILLTGLHCPPCAGTVQGGLARVKGIKSVTVNWNTKKAAVEFDEAVLPAQALAAAIEGTPHMMGGGMRYAGWLALKVPTLTDAGGGEKLKETLSKLPGVKSVAAYPAQHSAAVLFSGAGATTSQQVLDALKEAGIEAEQL